MTAWIGDKGWESGGWATWSRSNNYSVISTASGSFFVRSGTYAMRQSAAGLGGAIETSATYTITDANILSYLSERTVTFSVWMYSMDISIPTSIESGSAAYIKIGDNIGSNQANVFPIVMNTWTQFSVTRTITSNPTSIVFTIYFYKKSGGIQYYFFYDDMEATIPGGVTGVSIYPTNPTIRVTSIIHRFDRGVYNTELLFGDIISDFSIPNVDTTTTKAYQSKEELDKINKALPEPVVIAPQPIPQVPSSPVSSPPPPAGIVEPTQYAKDILGTSIAKQKGIEQGIEAIVTPYAIDVLKRNEQEAKLLIQIQKLTKAASATGITSYARSVLIKAAIDAKAQLKELYKQ